MLCLEWVPVSGVAQQRAGQVRMGRRPPAAQVGGEVRQGQAGEDHGANQVQVPGGVVQQERKPVGRRGGGLVVVEPTPFAPRLDQAMVLSSSVRVTVTRRPSTVDRPRAPLPDRAVRAGRWDTR